jgi:hypothetical protein
MKIIIIIITITEVEAEVEAEEEAETIMAPQIIIIQVQNPQEKY